MGLEVPYAPRSPLSQGIRLRQASARLRRHNSEATAKSKQIRPLQQSGHTVQKKIDSDNGMLVRTERLELSHLSILEPKSSASTNSATSAVWVRRLEKPFEGAHYTSPGVFAKNRRRCLLAVFAVILLRFP